MRDVADLAEAIVLPHPHPPAPGEVTEVSPGILWARMPMPIRLNHVNVWLIEEQDGWTAIDCGLDTTDTRLAWERLLSGPLRGRPIRRLVATHGHVDHVGLAGWISERFDAPFHATRAAWLWSRLSFAARNEPASPAAIRHLRSHGCAPAHVESYVRNRGPLMQMFADPPKAHIALRDSVPIVLGERSWSVTLADGHADEHASFYCADARVLIAGDQVLQRISPVVGVFFVEPHADPLSDYLASLDRFADLPEGTLVLPSHGLPFYGLHSRLQQLAQHHGDRLATVLEALGRPRTAADCAEAVFSRAVAEGQWFLALAETLAHLHRLETTGEVRRESENGLVRFART